MWGKHVSASPQTESSECRPLLEVANADLYDGNSFRITGLRVDATAREISRQVDALKYLEELGQGAATRTAAFALNPPPSVERIREAIARLKDPEHRLIDEFFWFWPEEFGEGSKDPALQAIEKGDQNAAYKHWYERQTDAEKGFVACHNLAVLYHLVALDWTKYHFAEEVDAERQKKMQWYWTESATFWERVGANDRTWDRVKARIRAMDDARVTAGFARRMEATLPRALGAVNASVALKFVEAGRIEWAKRHAEFLENGDAANLERTVEAVLSPVKDRIRHFVENAERSTARDAKQGNNAAMQLIEQVRPQLFLFDLFKGQQAHRNDFLDQVATVCVNCLVAYVKATDDDDSFVSSLRAAQPIAHSEDVKARIQKNIGFGEDALIRKMFAPIREKLEGIKAPASKLSFVHKELMPRLAELIRRQGDSASAKQFADGIAEILRVISLDAYNEHDDLETAQAASLLALKICKNPTLRSRLVEDQGQLRKFSEAEKQHDLHLEIRKDVVEVNKAFVRYNERKIATSAVLGVRFGIFHQYRNGVQTNCSYLVGILGTNGQSIEIECKRIFRSEEQAKSDYEAILNSVYFHVIAQLIGRMVKSVLGGGTCTLGDCTFDAKGMATTTGVLAWKKPIFVPYSEITYRKGNGALIISTNGGIKRTFEFRTTWNAVIFEQVTKGITQEKS
jgi:hypothetical protein